MFAFNAKSTIPEAIICLSAPKKDIKKSDKVTQNETLLASTSVTVLP